MRRPRGAVAAALVVAATAGAAAVSTIVASAARYAEGAPPGFSGGFGEESCHACHFHADPNSGRGRVTIEGVPQRFAAGERYTVTVTLTQGGMQLGGFQLTARFKEGGAQAGTLEPGPGEQERVGIESQGGVQYAGHRRPGAELGGPAAASWTLVWSAPPRGGPVVFNVAANATDGDESTRGDFVYTAVAETVPDRRVPLRRAPIIGQSAATASAHQEYAPAPVIARVDRRSRSFFAPCPSPSLALRGGAGRRAGACRARPHARASPALR